MRTVPAMRGAILAYGPADRMIRVSDLPAIPDGAWPLRGERGLTFSEAIPDGNVVTAGQVVARKLLRPAAGLDRRPNWPRRSISSWATG